MSKARDLANAGTALTTVSATELGYLDGVTSAVQTQIDSKEPTLPSQTGNSGKYLTTDGSAKSWGTVSQYALPSQTGNSGKFLTTNGTSESWGTVSQPVSFTLRFTPSTSWSPKAIATNGSTIYVAVGSAGVLYSSTDSGVTWTSRTSGFGSTFIGGIAYGNGIFVAVGNSGLITTSTDGVTWTARTAGVAASNLYYVAYINNLFVAVGGGANGGTGGITTSPDGITWTKRTTPTTSSTNLYSVTYGGGYYVAVGNLNTRAGYYSTDAATWTALPAGIANSLEGVFYNGSNFFALASAGTGWYVVGAPSGTWNTISSYPNPRVIDNSMNTTTPVYSGYMYFPTSTSPNSIHKVTTAMTGALFNGSQPKVNFPDDGNGPINAIFIDSNGKLTCADSAGRIYTAQL